MKLTHEQCAFFDTFGFLHVKGAMKKDLDWIVAGFESVHENSGLNHDGAKRTSIVPFIDSNERLCTLLEHPVVEGVAESLLGPDFNYLAGDGNYYVGDTGWHSDTLALWDPTFKFIKIAFYLDPLTRDTGALRVIPGSHLAADTFAQAAGQVCNSQEKFGIHGRDVPSVALETEPGDLAIFNHNTKHASFNGSARRRMFTLNLCEHCKTPQQIAKLKEYLSIHIPAWGPQTHSELMLRTANDHRMRHLRQVIEHEEHVKALHEAKRKKEPVAS